MNKTRKQEPIKKKQKPLSQSERTAQSNARMLEKAIDLIVENGVESMTLKEVGEAAGYSRGLASFHFGSKKNLVASVMRSIGDELIVEMQGAVRNKTGLAAICAAADVHYQFCKSGSSHVRAFYLLWFESITPGSPSKDIVVEVDRLRKKVIAGWIEDGVKQGLVKPGVDAHAIAAHFCKAIIGITWHWLVNPQAMDEIKNLHEGLKQVMVTLLSPKGNQRVKR